MSSGSTPQASLRRPDLWDSRTWEAYSAKYCTEGEPQPSGIEPGSNSGIKHFYSAESPCLNSAAGRASRIREGLVITLAFRGSHNPTNYMNDALAWHEDLQSIRGSAVAEPPSFQGMRLHHGFLKEYCGLRQLPKFQRTLSKVASLLEDNNSRAWLLLTGHSLGGALATICLIDLLLNKPGINASRICVITFGSPRVVNRPLAEWLSTWHLAKDIRVEIDTDIVPTIPDHNAGAYCHRGQRSLMQRADGGLYELVGLSEERVEPPVHDHPVASVSRSVVNFIFGGAPFIAVAITSTCRAADKMWRDGLVTPWNSHFCGYWETETAVRFVQ